MQGGTIKKIPGDARAGAKIETLRACAGALLPWAGDGF